MKTGEEKGHREVPPVSKGEAHTPPQLESSARPLQLEKEKACASQLKPSTARNNF